MPYPFNPDFGIFSNRIFPVPVICQDLISCALLVFYVALKILTWLSGALAVIMIMWAGIILIVQTQKAQQDVKNRLIWASLGLALALISWGLVKLIEYTVSNWRIDFIFNIAYAQQLSFQPPRINCTGINIFDILGGQPTPPGLVGKCLLWFITKILTVLYTVSMLSAIGFIIYGGMKLYLKPGDREGWNYITWAIIGAIFAVAAFSIVKAIEFSLTH